MMSESRSVARIDVHWDARVDAFEHGVVSAVREAPARCLVKDHEPIFGLVVGAGECTYRVC